MNATLVGKTTATMTSNTKEISTHIRPSPLLVYIYKKIFMSMECCLGMCFEIASVKYSFTLIRITMLHIHMVMVIVFRSKCFWTTWFFAWVPFTTMQFHVGLQGLLRLKCMSTAT